MIKINQICSLLMLTNLFTKNNNLGKMSKHYHSFEWILESNLFETFFGWHLNP